MRIARVQGASGGSGNFGTPVPVPLPEPDGKRGGASEPPGGRGGTDGPPDGLLPPRAPLMPAVGVSRSTITSAGGLVFDESWPQMCSPVFDALSTARARM